MRDWRRLAEKSGNRENIDEEEVKASGSKSTLLRIKNLKISAIIIRNYLILCNFAKQMTCNNGKNQEETRTITSN